LRHAVPALTAALVLVVAAGSSTVRAASLALSTVRINTGGAAYTATDGRSFSADANFTGGSTFSTGAAISGTTDPKLYQDERWGQFSYAIPVVNGTYDVTFHFVELYYTAGSCVGKRIFSMDILDTPTSPDIASLDICAAAGGADRALVTTVTGVQVGDGSLDITSVYGSADDPEVAAIEVTPSSATGAPTVTSTSPANAATGIGTGIAPTATFSRAMNAATITSSSFTLVPTGGGGPVAATVTYDSASNTATLTPTAPLTASTTYTATIDTTVKASDGTPLASPFTWSFTTAAAGGSLTTIRINSGGGAYTGSGGKTWVADQYFSGGSVNNSGWTPSGTSDPTVYASERWGAWSYAIPVTNGTYDVRLDFVELYYGAVIPGSCVGKRIFSVDIADTPANPDVSNLDICAAVGPTAALPKTIYGVTVNDGVLNIRGIYGSADDPEIAGIEVVPAGPGPSKLGDWGPVLNWPVVGVDTTLTPTGNVLTWDLWGNSPGSERLWNPTNNTFVPVPSATTGNKFCGGHVNLADGRTLVVGGWTGGPGDDGIKNSSIFSPTSNTWTKTPDMAQARWYPTATTLADGRVLVTSGDNRPYDPTKPPPLVDASNDIPEVYSPAANTWTQVPSAGRLMTLYPFMFVLPDGRIVDAGPDTTTRVLDPNTWTWSTVGTSPIDAMSAVMYRPGKILKSGTWSDPNFTNLNVSKQAAVIDMNQPNPAWRLVGSMAYPRAYHNLTVLPDGTVLASGGTTHSDGQDATYAVFNAELWNPDTEQWTTLPAEQIERMYHSTALLLPDGRVLVAGGGGSGNEINEANAEVYSPPYLFKGARPTITSAPSVVSYGSAFAVATPDAASISSVALIRLGSVTHGFNQEQRYVPLSFTAGAGSLAVTAPASGNLAPPGYYMLFLVNSTGVPSVASFVRLPAPWEDSQPPTAPSGLTATGSLGKATLGWTASTDNIGVSSYDVYRSTSSGFTPSIANRIAQTPSTGYTDTAPAGTYYYLVKAEDAAGNLSAASNQASATITADTTAPTVAISAPSDGATVSGPVTVSADASDNVAVAGVQFKLDGNNLGSEDGSSPYSVSWDTTTATNGSHALTAVARDAANNSTSSSTVSVTVSNTPPPPPTGLVASYNFNAGSGATLTDSSGSGNTGTITNATWSVAGKNGSALSFNGSSAYVQVADSASLHLTTAMTLEAWLNPSALGTAWRTVLFKTQTGGMVYSLYANQDTTRPIGQVNIGGEVNAIGSAALTLNAWSHLAATYDGSALRLYVNGTLVTTTLSVGTIPISTGVLRMGGNSVWGEWYKGLIDDVRIYNRALTQAQIQTDMNTPVP